MHRDTSLLHSPPQSYPHFLWNQTTTYHSQAPGKMIGVLVFPGNTRASEQDYLWTIHVRTINKPYLPIKNRPTYSATSPLRRMCFSQYHLYWVCKQFINALAKWPPPPPWANQQAQSALSLGLSVCIDNNTWKWENKALLWTPDPWAQCDCFKSSMWFECQLMAQILIQNHSTKYFLPFIELIGCFLCVFFVHCWHGHWTHTYTATECAHQLHQLCKTIIKPITSESNARLWKATQEVSTPTGKSR